MQIWTWIGLGSLSSEDVCSIASQISWRQLPISEGHIRKAGDRRCWQYPIPCQDSYVQPWWVWKDRIWYPFGCGEVTLTTETLFHNSHLINSQSEGTGMCDSWSLKRTCFWTAFGLCADTICCCFLKWHAWQWRNVLVPFPPGGGTKLMCSMLHLAGEPISPDAFRW